MGNSQATEAYTGAIRSQNLNNALSNKLVGSLLGGRFEMEKKCKKSMFMFPEKHVPTLRQINKIICFSLLFEKLKERGVENKNIQRE